MELTPYEQTMAFLWSFVLGVAVAVVYIVFGVIRALSPPSKVQLFFSDILLMVIVAVMNFLFAVSMTNGIIRVFSLAAEIGAFGVIYATVGKLIVRCSEIIKAVFLKVGHTIVQPLVWLCGKVQKFVSKTVKKWSKKKKIEN